MEPFSVRRAWWRMRTAPGFILTWCRGYELRDGEPDYTGRLCVIGTDIDEHRLEELFGIA